MRSIPARTALPGVELYGLQRVVFVDSENRIPGTRADLAEPVAGTLRGEFVR
ncbi:hypothetical protein ACFYXH_28565 [Streptomyces sp. NPDC002730]|uniref:hypothetical protein n=1 Tax=Streptomyces sp. NPDC002730 TaxID=3364662 RepID=UPI003682F888